MCLGGPDVPLEEIWKLGVTIIPFLKSGRCEFSKNAKKKFRCWKKSHFGLLGHPTFRHFS